MKRFFVFIIISVCAIVAYAQGYRVGFHEPYYHGRGYVVREHISVTRRVVREPSQNITINNYYGCSEHSHQPIVNECHQPIVNEYQNDYDIDGLITDVQWTFAFNRNESYMLNPQDLVNVSIFAKRYPRATFSVYGYADRETGTSEYNYRLSKRRADEVVGDLITLYGISPDRFVVHYVGSYSQEYDINRWNRCVLIKVNER